jgi:hypothetical protein
MGVVEMVGEGKVEGEKGEVVMEMGEVVKVVRAEDTPCRPHCKPGHSCWGSPCP